MVQLAAHRPTLRLVAISLVFLLILLYFNFFSLLTTDSYHSESSIPFVKSSYDWSNHVLKYPILESSMAKLPHGQLPTLPQIQHSFKSNHGDGGNTNSGIESRRQAVQDAFLKSWRSYKEYAWRWDELTPVSAKGKDSFGGWSATLVDSLDTLWIMGLHEEFKGALHIVGVIDWDNTTATGINLFETTIRHLGGLLSAYDLSGEKILLLKATELGDMLYASFDTPNHMPPFWMGIEEAKRGTLIAGTFDPSAAPCSLGLEFTRLSQLTGNPKYYDAIDRIKKFLEKTQSSTQLPGMWPTLIDFRNEIAGHNEFTLGALADSLYEYLPKMYGLLGGLESSYERMYRDAMEVVKKHLLFRPMLPDGSLDILFSGNAVVQQDGSVSRVPEGQHLSCFTGGMFGLGGKLFNIPEHVEIGEELAQGCGWAYAAFPTGIMPEIFGMIPCETPSLEKCGWDEERWGRDGDKRLQKGFNNARDPRYLLRPEAIESIFLLYRMTGAKKYRDMAWSMFLSIQNATETVYANSAIADVTTAGETEKLDSMEVFNSLHSSSVYSIIILTAISCRVFGYPKP
jgi:mannosyl-oligosaccharide alpha-1,2-mannosidase